MKHILTALAALFVLSNFTTGQSESVPDGDTLDETLALVGLQREDLGWRPKGYWTGFPADIPYKLRQFDDLFDEPLANISYLQTMAHTVRELLGPEQIDAKPARSSSGSLYLAVARLGVIQKNGQFRSYSCNLTAEDTPLDEAILAIYKQAQRPTKYVTFGDESPYPLVEQDLAEAVEAVPEVVQPIIGKLIMNILDAHYWATLALRNVPMEDRLAVVQRLNIGQEQVDALDYCPQFDDVAAQFDESSMWYAGLKVVEALDQTRIALNEVETDIGPFVFDWQTPLGWIRLRGTGNDEIDGDDTLLSVDLGGDDEYTGTIAASSITRLLGLALDMAGNDSYTGGTRVQGAGMCGVGVLLDVTGNDSYEAVEYAQGVGQFGMGVCIDLQGDDTYFSRYSAQGCGYFGIGLQMDAAGNDQYTIHADGQGLGASGGGVGVLVDNAGDDRYEAVRDPAITGRPSYHSAGKISVSNAQGCAIGRRGDGADGHAWAGGIGALIDIEGNDTYEAGNWSMGTGYWFGAGYLYDGTGDDVYRGVVWSQATGAHFCIGVLLDEGGNDQHLVEETSSNSLAFGHDFTIALLVNHGGNDIYETERPGLGYSINRSVAMLIDIGGDDVYRDEPKSRPGMAICDEGRLAGWDSYSTYFADSSSVGLFLDIGGMDQYEICRISPDRHRLHAIEEDETESTGDQSTEGTIAACSNNMIWLDPEDSLNYEVRNFSIGVDREQGEIDFRPIPEKRPSGK